MKQNVLIIGAGGVAHVAAHKAAMHNDRLGDVCVASRTESKAAAIIDDIESRGHRRDRSHSVRARSLDALDTSSVAALIRDTRSEIVLNLAQPYVNMSVLNACLDTGAAYLDTAVHEEPDRVLEPPPWYANYEWPRAGDCADRDVTAILGCGFDPGVVNAYCSYAARHLFDEIDTIDIVDVNAGRHERYFATNFDPEINFREFVDVWTYQDRQWLNLPTHAVKRIWDVPGVGPQAVYLTGHDEIHSLQRHLNANSVRFWMGFGDHYLNVFTVLRTLGLLSSDPVSLDDGSVAVPLKLVKALLPDPASLAPGYEGRTCIGSVVKGIKDGREREIFMHQISQHADAFTELGAQAISYTAGVPPVAAAVLIAEGTWDTGTMVNVEELDPEPFLDLLEPMGLATDIVEIEPGSDASFDGRIGDLATEVSAATATVTISPVDPMIAVEPDRAVQVPETFDH